MSTKFTEEYIDRMFKASEFLPEPGNEVVRECIEEIKRLRSILKRIDEKNIPGFAKEAFE